MELESKIREVISLIERYPIGEQTIPSSLLYELDPLKQRVDSFITQLKNHSE